MQHNSTYAKKRRSKKMMYGPVPKIPKYPDFRCSYPDPSKYWWGELRDKHEN